MMNVGTVFFFFFFELLRGLLPSNQPRRKEGKQDLALTKRRSLAHCIAFEEFMRIYFVTASTKEEEA